MDHPVRVAAEGGKPGDLSAAAGFSTDRRELAIVVSNFKSADHRIELVLQNLPWTGASTSEWLLLDQDRNLERVRQEEHNDGAIKIAQDLPAPGVLLLYVRSRN